MCGFEEPVAGADPGRHGTGAEVRVLAGLLGQLQAHGGDVHVSDGHHTPVGRHAQVRPNYTRINDELCTTELRSV